MFMKTILVLSFAILALAAPSPQDPDIGILTFAIDGATFCAFLLLSLFMPADQPHKDPLSTRVDFILMC
ncbi:hypothetical protein BGW80DRAFT_1309605 [Lactifluus volemus]|nr:hypothetical protein BGW80DRAFT_1309605 [Lactifluus volemus]